MEIVRYVLEPGKKRALCLLAVIAMIQVGCVYALGAQRHIGGANLPAFIPSLTQASTPDELIANFGEPTERIPTQNGETLLWREKIRPRGCRIYLFGVIPLNREPRATREVVVSIVSGHIEQAFERFADSSGVGRQRSLLEE